MLALCTEEGTVPGGLQGGVRSKGMQVMTNAILSGLLLPGFWGGACGYDANESWGEGECCVYKREEFRRCIDSFWELSFPIDSDSYYPHRSLYGFGLICGATPGFRLVKMDQMLKKLCEFW